MNKRDTKDIKTLIKETVINNENNKELKYIFTYLYKNLIDKEELQIFHDEDKECLICKQKHNRYYKCELNHYYCITCWKNWYKDKIDAKCCYCFKDLIKKL
jgi:hypothetical protein